jgi:excisionase family DNA binding protein
MTKLLTVAEAAEMLTIRRDTLWKWIRNGKFPAVVIGTRNYRIRLSDVEEFICGK